LTSQEYRIELSGIITVSDNHRGQNSKQHRWLQKSQFAETRHHDFVDIIQVLIIKLKVVRQSINIYHHRQPQITSRQYGADQNEAWWVGTTYITGYDLLA
jgi:hypothetical protein